MTDEIMQNFHRLTKENQKRFLYFLDILKRCEGLPYEQQKEIYDEIGIGLKAGIGRADNMEDAAYMADIGLEIIRAGNNKDWIHVIEEL